MERDFTQTTGTRREETAISSPIPLSDSASLKNGSSPDARLDLLRVLQEVSGQRMDRAHSGASRSVDSGIPVVTEVPELAVKRVAMTARQRNATTSAATGPIRADILTPLASAANDAADRDDRGAGCSRDFGVRLAFPDHGEDGGVVALRRVGVAAHPSVPHSAGTGSGRSPDRPVAQVLAAPIAAGFLNQRRPERVLEPIIAAAQNCAGAWAALADAVLPAALRVRRQNTMLSHCDPDGANTYAEAFCRVLRLNPRVNDSGNCLAPTRPLDVAETVAHDSTVSASQHSPAQSTALESAMMISASQNEAWS